MSPKTLQAAQPVWSRPGIAPRPPGIRCRRVQENQARHWPPPPWLRQCWAGPSGAFAHTVRGGGPHNPRAEAPAGFGRIPKPKGWLRGAEGPAPICFSTRGPDLTREGRVEVRFSSWLAKVAVVTLFGPGGFGGPLPEGIPEAAGGGTSSRDKWSTLRFCFCWGSGGPSSAE